jgi:integrase
LVAFWAFLRKANYTPETENRFDPDTDLAVRSVIERDGRYGIVLTKTKTIQFGERNVVIWLPRLNSLICPSAALDRLMALRGRVNGDSPLFTTRVGVPLTKRSFDQYFRTLLRDTGIDDSALSPHSLRRGGATFALQCGVPPVCIKLQGDWASDSWILYAVMTDKLKFDTVRIFEKAAG